MAKLRLEHVNCGVCGSTNASEFASGKDYEYNTSDDTFTMVKCSDCGNVYLNPRPAREELPVIYPPHYYSYNYHSAINPIAVRAKDFLDSLKVKKWLKLVTKRPIKFLDVGCGDGRYLRMFHKLGSPKDHLYGIEMSAELVEALQREGFKAYFGRAEEVASELPADFDLIVLLQVLEHVEHPAAIVTVLGKLLAPGGILVVETPNICSLDAQIFRRQYWGGYHYPRHWNLFNKETLSRMAVDAELQVRAFKFLPSQSFWIFSFHHYLSDRAKIPGLARLFDPLQNIPLLCLFTGFDIARAALGFQTSNIQMIAEAPRS